MSATFIKLPSGAIGCSIEQMNALSNHMRTSIDQLEAVFKGIDAKISSTTWAGADADSTANNWAATRSQMMNNLRSFLDCQARAVQSQASQQQGTSQG